MNKHLNPVYITKSTIFPSSLCAWPLVVLLVELVHVVFECWLVEDCIDYIQFFIIKKDFCFYFILFETPFESERRKSQSYVNNRGVSRCSILFI